MKNKIVEAAVMAGLGLVTLLTAIFTGAGVEIIVLGGLITVVGAIFLVMEIMEKKK